VGFFYFLITLCFSFQFKFNFILEFTTIFKCTDQKPSMRCNFIYFYIKYFIYLLFYLNKCF
jgi:hypothetical protein